MHPKFIPALAASLLFCGATITAAADAQPSKEEQEILQIERDACLAYLHGDAKYLEKLFTDDFSIINGRAEANGKAQELAEVRGKEIRYTDFSNREQVVRLHGDTCVVTGITSVAGADATGKSFAVEVKFTDVFARIDGRWRMLAGHSSRIPAKGS